MSRPRSKFEKGALVDLEIVEHIDDPKRYALIGRFKGSKKKHTLVRIGEGEKDVRPAEMIRMTAMHLAAELSSIYAIDARLRHMEAENVRAAVLETAEGVLPDSANGSHLARV